MDTGQGCRRFFYCTRCGATCTTCSPDKKGFEPSDETKCRVTDKDAPGGYYYCSWIELVPKKIRKKK